MTRSFLIIICVLFAVTIFGCHSVDDRIGRCPQGMVEVLPNICDNNLSFAEIHYFEVIDWGVIGQDHDRVLIELLNRWIEQYPKRQIVKVKYHDRSAEINYLVREEVNSYESTVTAGYFSGIPGHLF